MFLTTRYEDVTTYSYYTCALLAEATKPHPQTSPSPHPQPTPTHAPTSPSRPSHIHATPESMPYPSPVLPLPSPVSCQPRSCTGPGHKAFFLASRSHKFRPSFRCRTDLRFFSFFLFLACSLPTRKRAPYSLRINDFAEESASPPRALVRSVWVVRRSKPLHCEIRWPGRRACRMSHAMTCLSVPATTTSRSSQPVHLTSSSQRTPYTYL